MTLRFDPLGGTAPLLAGHRHCNLAGEGAEVLPVGITTMSWATSTGPSDQSLLETSMKSMTYATHQSSPCAARPSTQVRC